MAEALVPARYQPALRADELIVQDPKDPEALPMDVVFVGGGPAGLAGAIKLASLVREGARNGDGALQDLQIAVLEKAESIGGHTLSGAVVNPASLRRLFPALSMEDFPLRGPVGKEAVYLLSSRRATRIPTPPTMRNRGNYVASLCEVARWMAERAEELGVHVFPGFPVASLLEKDGRITGVRTQAAGLDRGGAPGANYSPAMDVGARVTVLGEGARGPLAQAYLEREGVGSRNPQIFSLGVKELWEVPEPLDRVVHTVGWPLLRDGFGGSFAYPMAENLVAIGIVVSLDYSNWRTDPHELLQELKGHPLFASMLEGGELLEWGAKTIPEGGYHSLPEHFHGEGVCIVGDSAGFVDVASLKGIHYAMESGRLAARAIFDALRKGDVSSDSLAPYSNAIHNSRIASDLFRSRHMRLVFKDGFARGSVKAALATLTGGRYPSGPLRIHADGAEPKRRRAVPDLHASRGRALRVSKADAVFKSGNRTRDDIPSHLIPGEEIPEDLAKMYASMCPAGVYEWTGEGLGVNPPNCIDCKATDVLGPRWTPREGGSGPQYRRM